MTTMPPEMSTAAANPSPSALTPAPVARDSLVSLQAQRSRFMINDILAAHQNGATNTTNLNIQQHQHTHQPYQQHMLQQQHQHQIALQHYIAQQQHLLQQRSQLNGSPTLPSSTSLLNQNPNIGTTTQQQQPALTSACVATTTSQGQPAYTHAFGHLPNSTLMSFSGGPNGLHAAQAAVHYANLQYRERERSERSRLLENDERSRSPAPIQSTHSLSPAVAQRDLCNNTLHNTSGISAGGGGSSISGDQASTIDDSDSDCGAKDDDGHSVKSSDNLMGLTKKQRKARTAFTDHQLQTLEKSFERQKYLSVQDRMELANKLELSDCQVKTWYQNRRTKWKRQTAVGLELLAEAGNYAAFQRLYGGSPYLAPWPYAAAAQAPPHLTGSTPIDLYYRQAAAAAVLQKPLTYRMYPSVPPLASAAALSSLPVHPPPPIPHLNASSSLTTLSNYYQTATQTLNSSNENNNFPSVSSNLRNASPNRSDDDEQRNSVEIVNRSPSPQLNPGSPPERNESPGSCPPTSSVSDNESDSENANIEV